MIKLIVFLTKISIRTIVLIGCTTVNVNVVINSLFLH